MQNEDTRRDRLEHLLTLAQTYRGWSRRQLAEALGRDPSNLVPASGLPKIDLVVELARALEWSVEEVVEGFWLGGLETPCCHQAPPSGDFEELAGISRTAAREGRHREAVDLARHAGALAKTADQRATACVREGAGWDGLGRYGNALMASRRGLAEPGVSTDRRLILQGNLANEYYTLWHPLEARSMANDLVQWYKSQPARSRSNLVTHAFAYYVRGNSSRRLVGIDHERQMEHASVARRDLETSRRLFLGLADFYGDEAYRGVADTCEGGMIEADVARGIIDPASALTEITEHLERIVDPGACRCADLLESVGWWCIYGCNIALRYLTDQRDVQKHLAVFTNKADEIAEQTDNWAMRERIVSMQYARRRRFADWTGVDADWTIDSDDVRAITGTMGRFPGFRQTGWKVLRSAQIVRDNERNGTKRALPALGAAC